MNQASTIEDIQTFTVTGPWSTKSGGDLNVLFAIPYNLLMKLFFNYDENELEQISSDIRGLRSYHISSLERDSVGANEWHKVRSEIITVTRGSIKLDCRDLRGNSTSLVVDSTVCTLVPPYIMHTYTVLEDNTEITVIANTLFNPAEPSTHDTYSLDTFTAQ